MSLRVSNIAIAQNAMLRVGVIIKRFASCKVQVFAQRIKVQSDEGVS